MNTRVKSIVKRVKGIRFSAKTIKKIVIVILVIVLIVSVSILIKNKTSQKTANDANKCKQLDQSVVDQAKDSNKINYGQIKDSVKDSAACKDSSDYNALNADQKVDQYKAATNIAKEAYISGDKETATKFAESANAAYKSMTYSEQQAKGTMADVYQNKDIINGAYQQ